MWSFTTDAATLRRVLYPHQFIYPNQSPIEWHTVLCETEYGVELTTSNNTLTFGSPMEVKVESDHDDYLTILFPTLKVMKYLKELGLDAITVSWSEFKLEINSTSGFVVFETGDPGEFFINWAMDAKDGSFEVDPKSLLDALRFVGPARSQEIIRPVLTTILMEQLPESMAALVATNGHIMGWTQIPVKGATGDFRFITDGLVTKFLADYFPIKDDKFAGVVTFMNTITEVDPMKVSWGENRAWFEHNECILMVHNPDGEYPRYQNVIPESDGNIIFLQKHEWLPLLKQMQAIIMTSNTIDFNVTLDLGVYKPDRITLTQCATDKNRITMPGKYQGSISKIHFNIKYLIKVIEAFPGMEIQMNLTGIDSAAKVTMDAKPRDYLYLLMPCGG